VVGVSTPEGAYQQVPIAVVRCSCERIHLAASEDTYGSSYDASFWLGVKFAQLNKWTELDLPLDDAGVTLAGD
jgi:hypothetical protein